MPINNTLMNGNDNLSNEIVENFFNIWILKECINNPHFKKYHKTFLDANGEFSDKKVTEVLKQIFNFISKGDVTTYRPNNISELPDQLIKKIASKDLIINGGSYGEDILTHIEGNSITVIDEGKIEDNEHSKRRVRIQLVNKGLKDYLDNLYSEGIENKIVAETKEDIIKKIIAIIRNYK